jgi:hypothetical protein
MFIECFICDRRKLEATQQLLHRRMVKQTGIPDYETAVLQDYLTIKRNEL